MPQSQTDPSAGGLRFYGWTVVTSAFITFGLAVGVPYCNLPFFYDYFQKAFHWDLSQITLGFPLAALATIWIDPLLIPRFSPRKLIVLGTGLTALSLFGMGLMKGSLPLYFVLYFVYTTGYVLSGPIPHQILVSHWFLRRRGRAMGFVYVGVGLFGGFGSFLVRGVTGRFGFQTALFVLAALMFATWPFALFLMRDTPSELSQHPDGSAFASAEAGIAPQTYWFLLRNRSFWLLLLGSAKGTDARRQTGRNSHDLRAARLTPCPFCASSSKVFAPSALLGPSTCT